MRSFLVLTLILIASPRALAETPEAAARHHFDEGTKAYALGEFQRAVSEYRAAYNAKPDPALLYNIAQVYRLSGDLAQALFFYRSYLRANPEAKNRPEVEKRIHDLDVQIQQHHVLSTQPPNETLSVARPPQASDAETPPRPALDAPRPATLHSVDVTPAPSPSPSLGLTASAPSPRGPVYKKWWLWTTVGVVAAGVAVGLGVGLTANGTPSSHFGDTHVF